jgi:hypothetical protein
LAKPLGSSTWFTSSGADRCATNARYYCASFADQGGASTLGAAGAKKLEIELLNLNFLVNKNFLLSIKYYKNNNSNK